MAGYDANKNGGHKAYGRQEPGYGQSGYPDHEHQPVILDSEGRKHDLIGYEYHNAQSYVTQTEQFVELRPRGGDGGLGLGLGLAGHNLSPRSKDAHNHGNKVHHVPWKTASDESSPKAHNQGAVYEKAKGGSPRYINGYNNNYNHNNGNPRYGHYSPPPPYSKPRSHYSSDDSDDAGQSDDEEGYDGVYNPNPKGRAKPITHFNGDDYDRKPKPRVNNYLAAAPHSYGVPTSIQPGSHPYYEQPTKGNVAYSPPSYEAPHNRPISRAPPQIKTKPADYPGKEPKFNGSPLKDKVYPTTIDSTEAKKRYGGVTVPTEQQKYSGTIDCRTAAEKYRGLFVPGNKF